jgi:hypothetical protein
MNDWFLWLNGGEDCMNAKMLECPYVRVDMNLTGKIGSLFKLQNLKNIIFSLRP